MLQPDLWHLLKRIYVDQHWDKSTTIEIIDKTARQVILAKDTEIWVYGYYRIVPTRLQWGFFSDRLGVIVIYDDDADEVTTVFKPKNGSQFLSTQLDAQKINRNVWRI